MPPNPRVMFFIDGSNFYFGLKNYEVRMYALDFRKLAAKLMGDGRTLLRIYLYTSAVDQDEAPDSYRKQQRFFSDLAGQGVELRLGYLQNRVIRCPKCEKEHNNGMTCSSCGHIFGKKQEKGVDVRLAVDLVCHASMDEFDIAYVVTSDGDLAAACTKVRGLNFVPAKRVFYVCLPPESSAMKAECDGTIKKGAGFYRACLI